MKQVEDLRAANENEPCWIPVQSSNMLRVRLWARGDLDVQFKGGDARVAFRYARVSPQKFIDMLQAVSIGSYFANEIKKKEKEHPWDRFMLKPVKK